jgi:fatty-acyl-CoA synthase
LHEFCRSRLAAYKTPRFWYFVDSFPFAETGKLQKFKLVQEINARRLAPAART